MRRSGALTLGVVLTLGGVTGGRGQELSGSVATASTPSSLGGFVLPALPENWDDLPFTLTASQTESYSSNINGIPLGVPVPPGETRADLTSTTNLGFSTKANVYNQQLYLDATFGVIRYLHQTGFNSDIYSLSAGDNWTLTPRCSGNLGVILDKSPSTLLTTLVGSGVNYSTTTSFNETGKCAVSNGFSVLFNSSWSDLTNSNPVDALNNSRSTMLSAGIEYAKGASTVTALANNSYTIYSSRGLAETTIGLANVTDFHTFSLAYTRQINPNLSVNALIGLVGTTNAFTLGLPRTLLPIYTLGTSWAVTPKVTLNASASKTVSPPTTIIANAEIDYTAQMTLTYALTPKVAVNVGGSIGYTSGAFTPVALTSLAPTLTGASDFYTANAGLSYAMTPFLSAAVNASYSERVSDHFITPEDVVTVSLNYRPY
jgi:Putative beta-barrel porin 2